MTIMGKLTLLWLLLFAILSSPVKASFSAEADYLLVWVLAGDYIDSGMRFDAAGDCFAKAQNIGIEMREVEMSPPKFICMPLAKDQPLSIITKQSQNNRFPF